VVQPSGKGVRAYDYANTLSDVETKLRRQDREENVLLVPALDD